MKLIDSNDSITLIERCQNNPVIITPMIGLKREDLENFPVRLILFCTHENYLDEMFPFQLVGAMDRYRLLISGDRSWVVGAAASRHGRVYSRPPRK